MALVIATVLFFGFFINVVYGATTGTQLLTDVQEMLVLFVASIAFVAAVLRREAQSKDKNGQ